MAVRPMTWNIFNKETGDVLTWEGKAIDFASEESANAFLQLNGELVDTAVVKEGILYYDGGYISESDLVHIWQQEMIAELQAAGVMPADESEA